MNSIEKLISQYVLKEILIDIIYITLSGIVLIFILILVHHHITQKKRKIQESNKERFTKILIGYVIADEPVELKDLQGDIEYQVFADVCIEIMSNLSRSVFDKIHRVADELDVITYLTNMSWSRSWVKQFYAIEKLGYLEIDSLEVFFTGFYNRTNKIELKIKAILSLSFIANIDSLKFITERLSEEIFLTAKLNEYIFTNVIKSLKVKKLIYKLPMYLNRIRDDKAIPLSLKKDLIHACHLTEAAETENAIMDYFYNFPEDIDLKIACIRTLDGLKSKNCREIVFSSLSHENWPVRAIAVKAAVNFEQSAIPFLKTLLYDSNYNVRINSAKALAQLGDEGITELKNEINSPNIFVRETVRFVLDIKDKLSYV